jgi:hypothetical protein
MASLSKQPIEERARTAANELVEGAAKFLVREHLARELLGCSLDGHADRSDQGLSGPLVHDPFEQ